MTPPSSFDYRAVGISFNAATKYQIGSGGVMTPPYEKSTSLKLLFQALFAEGNANGSAVGAVF